MVADPLAHFEEGSSLRRALPIQVVLVLLHLDQLLLVRVRHDLRDQCHSEEFFGCVTAACLGFASAAILTRAMARLRAFSLRLGSTTILTRSFLLDWAAQCEVIVDDSEVGLVAVVDISLGNLGQQPVTLLTSAQVITHCKFIFIGGSCLFAHPELIASINVELHDLPVRQRLRLWHHHRLGHVQVPRVLLFGTALLPSLDLIDFTDVPVNVDKEVSSLGPASFRSGALPHSAHRPSFLLILRSEFELLARLLVAVPDHCLAITLVDVAGVARWEHRPRLLRH